MDDVLKALEHYTFEIDHNIIQKCLSQSLKGYTKPYLGDRVFFLDIDFFKTIFPHCEKAGYNIAMDENAWGTFVEKPTTCDKLNTYILSEFSSLIAGRIDNEGNTVAHQVAKIVVANMNFFSFLPREDLVLQNHKNETPFHLLLEKLNHLDAIIVEDFLDCVYLFLNQGAVWHEPKNCFGFTPYETLKNARVSLNRHPDDVVDKIDTLIKEVDAQLLKQQITAKLPDISRQSSFLKKM